MTPPLIVLPSASTKHPVRIRTSRHKVKYLAADARMRGEEVVSLAGRGDLRCINPVELHMFGYPDEITTGLGIEANRPVAMRVDGRCRKCEPCLKHRSRLWTARAIDETKAANRTWFGTLTLAPDRQTWARYSALSVLARRGVSDPTESEIFRESVEAIGPEITRFLKRVRKSAPFRYLLVSEAHKSGLPHFHLLIHQHEAPLSKRGLEGQWRYGFSHWRLVQHGNEQACGYACKYLSKSALTRVRASLNYGVPPATHITGAVVTAARQASEAACRIQRACHDENRPQEPTDSHPSS